MYQGWANLLNRRVKSENQKHQQTAKSVRIVKYSWLNKTRFTQNDLHQIAQTPWQVTSRIRVDTLINGTNIKYEAVTRYII